MTLLDWAQLTRSALIAVAKSGKLTCHIEWQIRLEILKKCACDTVRYYS